MSRRAPCATVAAATLSLLCLPGIARAQSAPSVLFACINPGNGVVRVVAEGEACRSNETRLQWNVVGEQGPQGPRGEQGPQGVTGATGDRGATGATGAKGETGAPGQNGGKGDTGAPGEKGDKGETGAPGEKGDKGDKGDRGETGAVGATGATGDKGEPGAPGRDGAPGEPGATGLTGFVTTLGYDVQVTSANLPSVTTALPLLSMALASCATDGYKAGPNEMAFIDMGLQASVPSSLMMGVANRIGLTPMFTEDKNDGTGISAPRNLSSIPVVQSIPLSSSGSVHTVVSMGLNSGSTYRFMTGARANLSSPLNELGCRAVVIIARRP